MQADKAGRVEPREHSGEYRDTSARPPVRYSSEGKLIGDISYHCEKREKGETDNSTCRHLNVCPTIIPRSHWSCCGGIDRGSVYCIQSPHPGEFRDSSAKPSRRYSSFHDCVGRIRHYCCTEDDQFEGFRCAHLDVSDKIVNRSHWSCCGNTEKHSVSCLITASPNPEGPKMRSIHGANVCSKGSKNQVAGVRKMRSFSETFDPEVDSEFTEYDCQDASESDLSIAEYNDGPVVWSPSSSDRMFFDSGENLLKIDSLKILESEDHSKSSNLRSALRSQPVSSTDGNVSKPTAAVYFSPAKLQRIERLNKLYDKLVQKGFSVDFSRLRSKLLNIPLVEPHSELPIRGSQTSRPNVRLPDVSEELEADSKVRKKLHITSCCFDLTRFCDICVSAVLKSVVCPIVRRN